MRTRATDSQPASTLRGSVHQRAKDRARALPNSEKYSLYAQPNGLGVCSSAITVAISLSLFSAFAFSTAKAKVRHRFCGVTDGDIVTTAAVAASKVYTKHVAAYVDVDVCVYVCGQAIP